MNEENERVTLGSTVMEERKGAPGLPSDGRASAGPVTAVQVMIELII